MHLTNPQFVRSFTRVTGYAHICSYSYGRTWVFGDVSFGTCWALVSKGIFGPTTSPSMEAPKKEAKSLHLYSHVWWTCSCTRSNCKRKLEFLRPRRQQKPGHFEHPSHHPSLTHTPKRLCPPRSCLPRLSAAPRSASFKVLSMK